MEQESRLRLGAAPCAFCSAGQTGPASVLRPALGAVAHGLAAQRPPPSGLDYTGRQTAFGSGQVSPLLPAFAFSSRLSPALPGRPPPSGLSRCRPLTRPPRHFPGSPGTESHGPGRISVTLLVPLRLPPPSGPVAITCAEFFTRPFLTPRLCDLPLPRAQPSPPTSDLP